MCYLIVLMSSLLFYNVENSKKLRKTIELVGVLKLLTGSVIQTGAKDGCVGKLQVDPFRRHQAGRTNPGAAAQNGGNCGGLSGVQLQEHHRKRDLGVCKLTGSGLSGS